MKIAICDDQPAISGILEEQIQLYQPITFEIDVFQEPEKLLLATKNNDYAAFFLDIEFPQSTGIQIAEKIREYDLDTPIIFITSYRQYMDDVFRLHTFDYILKPIKSSQITSLLDRLVKYLRAEEKRFFFSFNKVSYSIPYRDILYFEKERRTVYIYSTRGIYQVLKSTNELLAILPNDFVQIHASYIVNSRYVTKIAKQTIFITPDDNSEQELPLSRKFAKEAKSHIIMNLRGIL